jgi:hypothetical protein
LSQVPPEKASPVEPGRYVILDTPDITPLGQILRHLKTPEEVTATLLLRNVQTGNLVSVVVSEIDDIDHERERGAIWFSATLADDRRMEAYVFATPQGEDREVLGRATVVVR